MQMTSHTSPSWPVIALSALFGFLLLVILALAGNAVLQVALFGVGFFVGLGLLWLDVAIFTAWYQFDEPFSRSFLFLLLYVPLLIFMLTSSSSALGVGLMIGFGVLRFFELAWAVRQKAALASANQVLTSGDKPFTQLELSRITVALGVVLALFILKILFSAL